MLVLPCLYSHHPASGPVLNPKPQSYKQSLLRSQDEQSSYNTKGRNQEPKPQKPAIQRQQPRNPAPTKKLKHQNKQIPGVLLGDSGKENGNYKEYTDFIGFIQGVSGIYSGNIAASSKSKTLNPSINREREALNLKPQAPRFRV